MYLHQKFPAFQHLDLHLSGRPDRKVIGSFYPKWEDSKREIRPWHDLQKYWAKSDASKSPEHDLFNPQNDPSCRLRWHFRQRRSTRMRPTGQPIKAQIGVGIYKAWEGTWFFSSQNNGLFRGFPPILMVSNHISHSNTRIFLPLSDTLKWVYPTKMGDDP